MTRFRLLIMLVLVFASALETAAQETAPAIPDVPAEKALDEWRDLQDHPLEDPVRNLRLELHLLYHVAAELEPWVDSLQAVVDDVGTRESLDAAVVDAYLGATEVLRAKHGTWPPSRLKWVRRGVQHLDGARELAPDDVDVVYLQAASTLFLPFFMARGDEAEEDLADLARILLLGPGETAPSAYDRMAGFVTSNLDRLDAAIRSEVAAGLGYATVTEDDGRP